MSYLTLFAISAVIIGIVSILKTIQNTKADANPNNQERDAAKQRQFEGMLQAGERLIAVCPDSVRRQYYWAVTDRRLLIEGKRGLSDIPRSSIKKVVGMDSKGNKCTEPGRMLALTVTADKKYTLSNGSAAFVVLANELMNGKS